MGELIDVVEDVLVVGSNSFSQTAMVYSWILYGFWINTRGLYDMGRK